MPSRVWVVRAGSRGEHEQYNIENDRTTIGWAEVGDIGPYRSKDAIQQMLAPLYPGAPDRRLANYASQLWAFRDRIQVGDLVIMPSKDRRGYIWFGRAVGPYTFDASSPEPERRKFIPVDWAKDPMPRSSFGEDLLRSLGAIQTVFAPTRNNAVRRLETIAAGQPDLHTGGGAPKETLSLTAVPTAPAEQDEEVTDPDPVPTLEVIEDRVQAHVMAEFKEHDLTWLVSEILESHEFVCQVSPPGPDGGVDILAGKGPLGMDAPIVVVEVKSEAGPVDVKVVRGLHSARERHNADQALLVAWGGVNKSAKREISTDSKFRVWDGATLMAELFYAYEDLPPETKRRIPLTQAWVLDEDAIS
ncbi:restriction endonuclease [Citricoccus alkalitolerans]|uniref:Restriction endonuclease n=1 Tax=Citricoccus alkalitolerans TaxID=246603 RepID=A0ABV8XWU1_9MICC